jgi:hypothetical protein
MIIYWGEYKYNIINIEALLNAYKEVGVEVNRQITEYMLMFRHQNAGQNHIIIMENGSF